MKLWKRFVTDRFDDMVVDLQHIASIASPPFEERLKISYLRQKLQEFKHLKLLQIDHEGNLSALYPGKQNKTILLVAHVDTALKLDNNQIRQDDKYIYGHGICDNSAGVVSLLYLLKYLDSHNITPFYNLHFLFSVGEEGIGGKRGMKYFLDLHPRIDAVINVESHNVGRITCESNGQFRAKISIQSKGGHSWRDYGVPNPVIILSSLVSILATSPLYEAGRTTCNFSQLEGGFTINSIPKSASVLCEFRTVADGDYVQLRTLFEKEIDRIRMKYGDAVTIGITVISDLEPIAQKTGNPLIPYMQEIHKELRIKSFFSSSNTDGDISMRKGIPTVTIGMSRGFNTHTPNEYLETESLKQGIGQLLSAVDQLASLKLSVGKL